MANTKLNVLIYQAKNGQSTFTGNISEVATTGVIVFDEYTQKIGINGKWFGIDDSATYNTLKSTVNDLSSKVGNNSVAKQISDALATALGNLDENGKITTTGTNVTLPNSATSGTIKDFLAALQSQINTNAGAISTANTNISNLQDATKTDNSSLFVVRDKTGEGHTDFANTTDIKSAIDDAESNAKTFATNADTALKGAIEGTASKTIPVTTGSGEQATTTNVSFNDHKSIGYLWDLVSDAYGKIDTLSGTDLANVQGAIAAIKRELTNGDGADLAATLIDKLNTFLGGDTSWDADGNNTTDNATTVAQIIAQLKTYASGQASAAQSAAETTASGLINALDATADSTKTAIDGNTNRTAANSGVFALQAITETDGKFTSMTAIEVDRAGAAAAVLGKSGDASNANTVYGAKAYTDGAKSDIIGASTDTSTADTINGAKAYANSVAGSVVSWTVVTGNES